MATRLYQVLTFANVAAGGQATLAHSLNVNGIGVVPDFLYPDAGGFTLVSATTAEITVQNNSTSAASLDLALFSVYSIARLFGQGGPTVQGSPGALVPQPFMVNGGAALPPGANLWAPGTAAGAILDNNASGNLAGGVNAVAEGDGTHANGFAAHAEGGATVASGDYTHAEGSNTQATANYAHAEGSGSHASGQYAHAEGSLTVAQGLYSHAEGSTSQATGDYAHAEGSGTLASGLYAHAGGTTSQASGDASLAHGDSPVASGYASTAIGESAQATAEGAFATGAQSSASRSMQFSHAAGRFAAFGDAQSSFVEMRGSTPGAAPGETVELKFGFAPPNQTLQLEDGKGYIVVVEAIASDTVAGGKGVQGWVQRYAVRRSAGLTVIAAAGAVDQFGDAASATWTLTASVGAVPDRFVLTFATVGAQAAARCVAKVSFTEVGNP